MGRQSILLGGSRAGLAGVIWAAVADLTQNQIRLLRELDFYGGSLIIRARANNADYMLLEKRGFITASALTMSEVLYKITKDGREQLSRRL